MKRILALMFGYVWMLPNVVASALTMLILGLRQQVKFRGFGRWSVQFWIETDSWLWRLAIKTGDWNGFAFGPFVVLKVFTNRGIKHEERHVQQQMVFGAFQPFLYYLISIGIWLFGGKNRHSYLDNPFEKDARKYAGQQVHVPREQWKEPDDRWLWW